MFCKECGKALHGRSDKLFCDADCRSSYHNRKRRAKKTEKSKSKTSQTEEEDYFSDLGEALNSLKRNHLLIKKQKKKGINYMPAKKFERMGFDFSVYSHLTSGMRGEAIYHCYDEAYRLNQDGDVVFMSQDEAMFRFILPLIQDIW